MRMMLNLDSMIPYFTSACSRHMDTFRAQQFGDCSISGWRDVLEESDAFMS